MSDSDQQAVVRDHGVGVQPTINHLETAISTERVPQAAPRRFVQED